MGGSTNLPCWLMVWISLHPAWLFIELSIDLCFRDKWPCDSPTQLAARIRARSTRENRLWRCLLYLHSPLWCWVRSSLRTQTTAPISSTSALNTVLCKTCFSSAFAVPFQQARSCFLFQNNHHIFNSDGALAKAFFLSGLCFCKMKCQSICMFNLLNFSH